MKRKKSKWTPLQIIAHIGAWIPLVVGLWDLWQGNLGPDIIREATLRTGKTALILLLLSLACTPINFLFKFRPALKLRRPLGLYSFMYASIHFAIFIGVDYFFDFGLIQDALLEKRYAIVGFTTGLILLSMAITSTIGWQRRLKKNWKRLHRLAYVAGILAVVHYIWLVKQGVSEPWIYAGIVVVLLSLRIKPIKNWVASLFRSRSSQTA
ncbi:MAG: sulfoxide reductase heme-binding subunit YedZ [Anaerolineales bacterium]|nr:sulfoxide reductase heme-binding subunit YedZ [Chloroflexota bacterium]MBL6980197.1 sulfoxide reductase heme-binding subunit YedZ [Anaerolineales bacterium]